jgi:hypothetical protein
VEIGDPGGREDVPFQVRKITPYGRTGRIHRGKMISGK